MAQNSFQGWPTVKIEGTEVPPDVSNLFDTVIIDDHLHLPDKLTMSIRDPHRDVFDKSHVKIGAKIEVAVVSSGRGAADGDVLFRGEITGIEADYDVGGQRVMVRAYDLSHRMHRGRHTEAYKDKTDTDIAKKLAQRCGLDLGSEVDESRDVHQHVSQVNLTDWEFIKSRAREIGFETGVSDGKFFFRRPRATTPGPRGDLDTAAPLNMAFGADLLEFHPRISASAQVAEVYARGWNYVDKREVIGHATTQSQNAAPAISTTPDSSLEKFAKFTKPFVVTDRVLATDAEARKAAEGMAAQISSTLAEADGVSRGNPKVRAGASVVVGAVAPAFEGTWTVTGSRHVFDPHAYKTHFSVAGRQERSLLGLASMGATSGMGSAGGPPVYGVVVAQVTNIKDPDGMHRVKLKFPWLSPDYETDWVRMTQVGAGKERGLVWLPEVDDEVLVAFEQGDVRRPYVIGMLFNGKDTIHGQAGTKLYDGSGRSVLKGLRSRNGHRLVLQDDFDGRNAVWIGTGDSKHHLVLNQGDNKVVLHSDGSIEITATKDIKVTGMNISVKADQKLELKAGTELNLSAPQVKIAGDAMVDIDGGMVTLN